MDTAQSPPGGTAERIRPSRVWFAVAAVLFVISLVPTYVLGRIAVHSVHVQVAAAPATVTVGSHQIAIYTDRPSVRSHTQCLLLGAHVWTVPKSHTRFTVTVDRQVWRRLGTTRSAMTPGRYHLVCRHHGSQVDASSLGVSAAPRFKQFAIALVAAIVVPGLALVVAVLLVIVVALMRSRARRRSSATHEEDDPHEPRDPPTYGTWASDPAP